MVNKIWYLGHELEKAWADNRILAADQTPQMDDLPVQSWGGFGFVDLAVFLLDPIVSRQRIDSDRRPRDNDAERV